MHYIEIAQWKSFLQYHGSTQEVDFVPVTLVGTLALRRDRLHENENGYAILQASTGKALFGYDYGQTALQITGDFETRKLFHARMLTLVERLDALVDWSTFSDLDRDTRDELASRSRAVRDAVCSDEHLIYTEESLAYDYDESNDVVPVQVGCDHCGDLYNEDDLTEQEVDGETQNLCTHCENAYTSCDDCGYSNFNDCGYSNFNEDGFYSTDNGTYCEGCYDQREIVCDRCDASSHDRIYFNTYNGETLCDSCYEEAQAEDSHENHPTPLQYLQRNMFRRNDDNTGFLVYKSFGSQYAPPDKWTIEAGSTIDEEVDSNLDETCSYGINVASLSWVLENSWEDDNTWLCSLSDDDLETTVVPYDTDGKFRCSRLTLLYRIDRDGNRADEPVRNS